MKNDVDKVFNKIFQPKKISEIEYVLRKIADPWERGYNNTKNVKDIYGGYHQQCKLCGFDKGTHYNGQTQILGNVMERIVVCNSCGNLFIKKY